MAEARDRLFLRGLVAVLAAALGLYLVCDLAGWVPARLSVQQRSRRRAFPTPIGERYESFDPDLCLGIAIGSTRYRLNYPLGHAIVTRPLFGVRDWEIPERFNHEGQSFEVTALDPFALLNAHDVRSVSLPPTMRWLNGAVALAGEALEEIRLRRRDGTEERFEPPFTALAARPDPLFPEPEMETER